MDRNQIVDNVQSDFERNRACDAAYILGLFNLEERAQILRQVQAQNTEYFKAGLSPRLQIDFRNDGKTVDYGVTLTQKGKSSEIYHESTVTDPQNPDHGKLKRSCWSPVFD